MSWFVFNEVFNVNAIIKYAIVEGRPRQVGFEIQNPTGEVGIQSHVSKM
ncbi:MAG: hypothetical protein JW731_14395 [Bacteroidales bacterium]|nr:hypothetical protein [Bacteroidales bacterium]